MKKLNLVQAVKIYLFAIVMLINGVIYSQGIIELNSRVDKSKIKIGDLITYTITIKRDKDVEVQLPELGANLGQFEIRDYKVYDKRKEGEKIIDQVDYIISTFDTGEYEIPPVEIKYKVSGSKEVKVLKTDRIKIEVESMNPSEAGDIKEIKPPVDIPYNWRPVIYLASIVAAVVAVMCISFYLVKRYKRKGLIIAQESEPARPAHEIAYERLKQLSEADLLANGNVKQYYIEISEIIRQYVEGRYGIVAMELTTTDLINKMRDDSIARDHVQMFEEFLRRCDLVKFAKYIPTDAENNGIMELAFSIVDKTKVEPFLSPVQGEEQLKDEESKIAVADRNSFEQKETPGTKENKL
jgi:hypothetical protein